MQVFYVHTFTISDRWICAEGDQQTNHLRMPLPERNKVPLLKPLKRLFVGFLNGKANGSRTLSPSAEELSSDLHRLCPPGHPWTRNICKGHSTF